LKHFLPGTPIFCYGNAWKLLIAWLALWLGACHSMPGLDDQLHGYKVEQQGIAIITRVEIHNGKTWIDFDWQVQNRPDLTEHQEQIDISTIEHLPAELDLITGARLPLRVIHRFSQRGVSTPVLLQSRWRFDESRHFKPAEPAPAIWHYRPPRCINQ